PPSALETCLEPAGAKGACTPRSPAASSRGGANLGHSVPSERSAPRATGRRLGTLASEEDRGPLVRSTLGPTAGGGGVGLGRREEGGGRGEDGRVKAGRDKIHFSEFSGSEHANTLVPSCTYSHRAFRATYRHDIQVSRFASLMLKKEGDDFKGIA
ncbi:unnamed protein product, partial [Prorocentrum cordatum]